MTEEMDRILDSIVESDETIFTSRRGLKLKLRRVNPRLYTDAQKKLPKPTVPTVWIEEKERNEENPNHPDYLEALETWNYALQDMAFNLAFLMGVEEVLETPADIIPLDSEEWVDLINDVNEMSDLPKMEVPPSGNRRKLLWLKFYALEDMQEQAEVLTRVLSLGGGVVAEKIQEAMESFRDSDERPTNNGVVTIEEAGLRNPDDVPTPINGPRVRSPRRNDPS